MKHPKILMSVQVAVFRVTRMPTVQTLSGVSCVLVCLDTWEMAWTVKV